jgi:hypothetical protein
MRDSPLTSVTVKASVDEVIADSQRTSSNAVGDVRTAVVNITCIVSGIRAIDRGGRVHSEEVIPPSMHGNGTARRVYV